FGTAMAIDDANRLLIGAPASDRGAGRIYATRLADDGSWAPATRVDVSPAPPERAGLGSSFAINAGRAYIGAPGAGRVLVLAPGDEAWSIETRVSVTDAMPPAADDPNGNATRGSGFGQSLAVVGDELWIGAPGLRGRNGRVFRYSLDEWPLGAPTPLDADSADGTHWPFN